MDKNIDMVGVGPIYGRCLQELWQPYSTKLAFFVAGLCTYSFRLFSIVIDSVRNTLVVVC